MKSNRTLGLLLIAAAVSAGAAAAATQATQATTAAASTPAGRHWHHRHCSMLVGTMLRATRQLDLTAEQQQTIKGILSAARSQHQRSGAAPAVDMTVLANPGDPNYATALQTAKARAASRLQSQIELQGQIYNVLTAEQKAKLPEVLADMKTKAAQRRAAWQQQHAAGVADTAGSN